MNDPSLDPPPLGEKGSNEITSQPASQPTSQAGSQSVSILETIIDLFRVLAGSYLMTLCVIFPIHVNFPITSRRVLKATIHRKKWIVLPYLRKLFFFKKTLLMLLYIMLYLINFSILSRSLPIFHVSLSYHLSVIFGISRSLHAVLSLTLSWRRPLSNINQSSDLVSKIMDWFLYDNGLRHERVIF